MYFLRENNYFWKIDTTIKPEVGVNYTVTNFRGGYHYHTLTDADEVREFDTWPQAILASQEFRQDTVIGWLSPDGHHFACEFAEHSWFAYDILGVDEDDLEAAGWVKITNALGDRTYFFFPASPFIKLTQEQIRWLSDHDFEIKEWDRPN